MKAPATAKKPASVKDAIVKEVDPMEAQAISAVKLLVPLLVAGFTKVLQTESLGASRAYVLSDIPALLAGDRMPFVQLNKRMEAANMKAVFGSLAGKIRGEIATPLFNTLNTGRPATQEPATNEALLSEVGL